ncbi:MAG TPA: GAF domain-containing protein [Aggregatilineaceae bacterium]|nr:GAF domain-containing protein [Aggregatilineaceae bacterium]
MSRLGAVVHWEETLKLHIERVIKQKEVPTLILIGLLSSVVCVAWAALALPGAAIIRWVAFVPLFLTLLLQHITAQQAKLSNVSATITGELQPANEVLQQQVQDLTKLRDVLLAMGASFDRKAILEQFINALTDVLHFDRGLVLLHDEEGQSLVFGAYSHAAPSPEAQVMLERVQLSTANAENDVLLARWFQGENVLVEDAAPYLSSRLNWLLTTLDLRLFYSVPLRLGDQLRGVIVVDNTPTGLPFPPEARALLDALAANIVVTLENARLYWLTDEQLDAKVQELSILSRIDHELNEALSVDRVLNLTLDWALRFTGSQAGAVVLVDHATDQMQFLAGYGYDRASWEQLQSQPWPLTRGVVGRVARRGVPEIVLDVAADPDYVPVIPGIVSQLVVPVTREDRVIAVISLVSRQVSGFAQANLEFVSRLAARAAIAIDNAHLFDETCRERQKLELILSSTVDAVIVVGFDGHLLLVNQAALSAFHLNPKTRYLGQPFLTVFLDSPLMRLYERALTLPDGLSEELVLPEERTFHISILPTPQVGWSIVMHDVTPFKKTEQLKNELVATTSHDLKNPLGAILGYVDLIQMTNKLNEQGLEYVRRAQRSVSHMRNLIDDLLDMARIESGITLRLSKVSLGDLAAKTLENFALQINTKKMAVEMEIQPDLPVVCADQGRLGQIMANLISNAIKYTPAEGKIRIIAEAHDTFVRFAVQDTGMGISPEDQTQVFARFYRVRTAQTDGIEGTGLGLAIAKGLIEAHGGQIGLKSRLGEGSTFFFTIPRDCADTNARLEDEEAEEAVER